MSRSFGLSTAQQTEIQQILQDKLKNYSPYSVWIFGSRARGDHKQYSDLDIWLETSCALSDAHLSELQEQFQDSDLPIKIDIVTPDRVLAEYLPSIANDKREWFNF